MSLEYTIQGTTRAAQRDGAAPLIIQADGEATLTEAVRFALAILRTVDAEGIVTVTQHGAHVCPPACTCGMAPFSDPECEVHVRAGDADDWCENCQRSTT